MTTLSGPSLAIEASDQLEVYGTLELEYGASRGDSGNDYGTALATGALGATFKPNDTFDVTATLLYEEDLHAVATPVEADEALITWHALPDEKLDISAGQQYLPFGSFETAMVSDPLTLELGETRQDKVLATSGKMGNLRADAYGFEGESKGGYGVGISYETENAYAGVDYLSSLLESDVGAVSVHGTANMGRITLTGEHLTATESFQPGALDGAITTAAKPAATHLEAAYDLHDDRTLAIAWNQSKAAVDLGLPRKSYGVTYSQPIYKALSGALELVQARQYSGDEDKTFTAQLAYEF